MGTREHANRFADCVVGRVAHDTVMKPGMVIATMAVPAFMAVVMTVFIMDTRAGSEFTDDGILAGLVTAMVTECCVVGFMFHMLASRTAAHQRRDAVWADSLVGYAESRGADTAVLKDLAGDMRMRGRTSLRVLSLALWSVSLIMLLALVFLLPRISGGPDIREYSIVAAAYVILILQFLISTGSTYGFPHSHEMAQIRFTEELAARLRETGMDVEPMERMVGRPHRFIAAFLVVVTLGLFTLVLFPISCRGLNLHLRNQWDYEEGLLRRIIEAEGASGVRPVEKPSGRGARTRRSVL